MEEFRDRLLALSSLNDIRALCREFTGLELTESLCLPFFVVASALEELYTRLDRPLDVATWDQVRDRLRDPLERVIDAYETGDRSHLCEQLNLLTRRWAQIRQELQ